MISLRKATLVKIRKAEAKLGKKLKKEAMWL